MNFEKETVENETVIDWQFLLKAMLAKAWIIILVGVVVAGLAAGYAKFFVDPMYASTVMLHAENNNEGASDKVNASDLAAAQSLIDTFIVILNTDTTMEKVKAETGLEYSVRALRSMVSAEEITGTEIFTVTVTCKDAEDAAVIANAIATTFPAYAESIKQGSDIEVVEYGKVNRNKVSPNVTVTALQAAAVAVLIAAGIIALIIIFDDTIRNGDYIIATYDAPILSKIPELTEHGGKSYSHYGKYGRYGRYGKYGKGED